MTCDPTNIGGSLDAPAVDSIYASMASATRDIYNGAELILQKITGTTATTVNGKTEVTTNCKSELSLGDMNALVLKFNLAMAKGEVYKGSTKQLSTAVMDVGKKLGQ
jgi:hypothetical protein